MASGCTLPAELGVGGQAGRCCGVGSMRIYASLDDDIGEGFVWLRRAGLPTRGIVKITHPDSGRSVFCEALQFEDNFLRNYNQSPRFRIDNPESSLVMSGWYRARLGDLQTQWEYPLEITQADSWWGKIRACMHHPQVVVRVAVWLGLLSVVLGVVGVLLGGISLLPAGAPS